MYQPHTRYAARDNNSITTLPYWSVSWYYPRPNRRASFDRLHDKRTRNVRNSLRRIIYLFKYFPAYCLLICYRAIRSTIRFEKMFFFPSRTLFLKAFRVL